MRGEIFETNYKEPIKKNEYISDDLDTLQEHYTLMLEYIRKLETENIKLRNENERLIRRVGVLSGDKETKPNDKERPKPKKVFVYKKEEKDEITKWLESSDLWLWLQQ